MRVTNATLKCRQPQSNKETDTYLNISLLPTLSTVVVQWKYRGLWITGTIIGHRSKDHNVVCYKIRVTKTGCAIIVTKQHMTATPISTEYYLRNEIMKGNK